MPIKNTVLVVRIGLPDIPVASAKITAVVKYAIEAVTRNINMSSVLVDRFDSTKMTVVIPNPARTPATGAEAAAMAR
jgi:hypothetical protein